MVQKERKSGHWQVERLQFLKREQRGLRLRYAVIDLQPCDLQTAKFSCLLHHKGALIFQIKRPLFWKNARICPSLVVDLVFKVDAAADGTQGVTDHCFVSGNWTFCSVFWLFGSVHLRGFCVNSLKKMVVSVS